MRAVVGALTHIWLAQVGSVTLFGMYVVVTYVGKEWINWFLGWYFALAGVGSVWKVRRDCDAWHVFRVAHPYVSVGHAVGRVIGEICDRERKMEDV